MLSCNDQRQVFLSYWSVLSLGAPAIPAYEVVLNAKWENWVHWVLISTTSVDTSAFPHRPQAATSLVHLQTSRMEHVPSCLDGQDCRAGPFPGTMSPGTALSSWPGAPQSLPGIHSRRSNNFDVVAKPTSALRSCSTRFWGFFSHVNVLLFRSNEVIFGSKSEKDCFCKAWQLRASGLKATT